MSKHASADRVAKPTRVRQRTTVLSGRYGLVWWTTISRMLPKCVAMVDQIQAKQEARKSRTIWGVLRRPVADSNRRRLPARAIGSARRRLPASTASAASRLSVCRASLPRGSRAGALGTGCDFNRPGRTIIQASPETQPRRWRHVLVCSSTTSLPAWARGGSRSAARRCHAGRGPRSSSSKYEGGPADRSTPAIEPANDPEVRSCRLHVGEAPGIPALTRGR